MSTLEFWQQRITKTQEMIVAYEDAIAFLSANPTKSYRLDTGQNEQEVTHYDLKSMQQQLDTLLNRLTVLEKRTSGCPTISLPAW